MLFQNQDTQSFNRCRAPPSGAAGSIALRDAKPGIGACFRIWRTDCSFWSLPWRAWTIGSGRHWFLFLSFFFKWSGITPTLSSRKGRPWPLYFTGGEWPDNIAGVKMARSFLSVAVRSVRPVQTDRYIRVSWPTQPCNGYKLPMIAWEPNMGFWWQEWYQTHCWKHHSTPFRESDWSFSPVPGLLVAKCVFCAKSL